MAETAAPPANLQPTAEHESNNDHSTVPKEVGGVDAAAGAQQEGVADDDDETASHPKGLRFWLIIVGLLIATVSLPFPFPRVLGSFPPIEVRDAHTFDFHSFHNQFLSALDLTAISTALPTIAASLHSEDFSWIGNSYSIASAAIIPWSGGLAHVFGRRPILLGGLTFFGVGSAMCGAAKNMNTMLAGRTFQGVGSGVILSLTEIVLADLVPLSERGAYQGAFGAIWALASAVGPVIGGAWAGRYWKGLFLMNLPLTLIVFLVIFLFMKLKTPEGTIGEKVKKMDWIGNAIFIPSITIFIMGLVWGGEPYAWSSAHVLAPLVLGAAGLVLWFFVERYYVKFPTVPFETFANTTTVIGFFTTFIHGIVALALFYFWPVYFQSVKGASPIKSSIDFFSVAFIVAPFAMVAGGTISATQVFRPQNVIAWVFLTFGPGLISLVKVSSPVAAWAPLPIPMSIGIGLLYAATVFPVLAPLPPHQAGHALAFLVFIRSFGNIFGITIGTIVLTNELGKKLPAQFIAMLPGGVSGAYASIPIVKTLAEPLKGEVQAAFAASLRVLWLVLIPFGGIGLVASLFMKSHALVTETDETFGIKEKKTVADQEKAAA